jgi:hypothetical protein
MVHPFRVNRTALRTYNRQQAIWYQRIRETTWPLGRSIRLWGFSDFGEMTDNLHFSPLPSDWVTVVTDVRESTKAIQEGRHKDMNKGV